MTQTALEVELFRVLDGTELTVTWLEKEGENYTAKEKFRFGNADGNMYESDLWGWVPDVSRSILSPLRALFLRA